MIVTDDMRLTEALEALARAEYDRLRAVDRMDTCTAFDLIDEVYRIEKEAISLFTGGDRRWNPAYNALRERLLHPRNPEA